MFRYVLKYTSHVLNIVVNRARTKLTMPWMRPSSVPLGRVWSRFQGRQKDAKPAKMYQIRDMDDKWKSICLDMMQETFLRDEPLCEALDITKDPVSIATIRANWEGYVSQNISLACFTEENGEPDELVGFNIILVKTIYDEDEDLDKVQGEPWKKLLLTLIKAEELVDLFKLFNVDQYLTSSGLTVVPEHRGQNIGARFFEARVTLCKALGIQATATVLTAYTSQALAAKCGYQLLAELKYSDMLQYGVQLVGSSTPTAKVMGIKIQ